jgi:hypothetical protein
MVPELFPGLAAEQLQESPHDIVSYVEPEDSMASPEYEAAGAIRDEDTEVLEQDCDLEDEYDDAPNNKFGVLQL